jgi:hypothetical protein
MSGKKSGNPTIDTQNTVISYLIDIISHSYQNRHPIMKPEVEKWLESTLAGLNNADINMRFQNLTTLTKCHKCLLNLSNYRLNCSHLICESCLQQSLDVLKQNLIETSYSYHCPVCSYSHSLKEIENLTPTLSEQISSSLKTYKTTRVKKNIDLVCSTCKYQLNKSYFPQPPPCAHHNCCKECLATSYTQGKYECQHCGKKEKFKSDPTRDKGVCNGCFQEVYYIGDCLTRACQDHFHCYECLKFDLDYLKCKTCSSSLTEERLNHIRRKTSKICSNCNNTYLYCLFVNKSCCSFPICAFCQANIDNNFMICKGCNNNFLDPASIELVLEVQASAEDLSHVKSS